MGSVEMGHMAHMGHSPCHIGMSKIQVLRLQIRHKFPTLLIETRMGNIQEGKSLYTCGCF